MPPSAIAGAGYGDNLHALLLFFPVQGHLNPMLQLAGRLLSSDISVIFVTTQPFYNDLLEFWRRENDRVIVRRIPDPFDGNPSHANIFRLMASEQEEIRQPVEQVLQILLEEGVHVGCIVFDFFLSWAVETGEYFGIPSAGFCTSSFAYMLFCRSIPSLIQHGYLPVKKNQDSAEELLVPSIPGFPALRLSDFPAALQFGDPFDPLFRSRIKRSKQLEKADWLLANTFQELEHASMAEIPQSIAIGPLLLLSSSNREAQLAGNPGAWKEDHLCIEWLDSKPNLSVLYISFGSLAGLSFEQMQELAEGLEASGQYFLWVFRQDLVHGSVQIFVDDFMLRNRDKGLIISWAPQLQVLGHPAVGGFLTHCGWNSTLESMCMGVPLLCWPCVSEQHLNSKFIVDVWKIGLRFAKGKDGLVRKNDIARLVRRLMKEDEGLEIRKALSIFKDAGRRAMLPQGSSCKGFQRFVEEMSKDRK